MARTARNRVGRWRRAEMGGVRADRQRCMRRFTSQPIRWSACDVVKTAVTSDTVARTRTMTIRTGNAHTSAGSIDTVTVCTAHRTVQGNNPSMKIR